MSVGASLKRTVDRWFEAFGTRDSRAVGDLVDPEPPGPRHGPPACDLCGRRLLLGEPLNRFHKDDCVVVICPVCEPEALLVGYVRLPSEGDPARWYTIEGQVMRVERPAPVETIVPPAPAPSRGSSRNRRRFKTAA
jgi:hypothetical protein